MKKSFIGVLALSLAIASCNKDKSSSNDPTFGSVTSIEDLKVPSSFNWASSKAVMSDISIVGTEGKAKAKVRVDIYDVDPYSGGKVLYSGFTDAQGRLDAPVKILSGMKEVVVVANTLGIGGNRMTVPVVNGKIKAHFSGVAQPRKFDKTSAAGSSPTAVLGYSNTYYLGGFNANGVPSGMSSIPVAQAYLDNLDLVLPEKNHLPCDNVRKNFLEDLFCNQVTTSKDDAEVFVTFLAEGAGFKNALAYYYYPAGSPPASSAAIDSIFVIFPDASEGAGKMQAGDRVKLGTFPKNTTIEWVLLGNAWNQAAGRDEFGHAGGSSTKVYYGEDAFNADMGITQQPACLDPNFKRHMISLTDNLNGEEIQIFSFEDIAYPYGDYDFNDCIFFATGDLYPSCAPPAQLPNPGIADTDGDGIIDQFDDEPNNVEVACLINWKGTLVFEDLWPAKGDYDFNDLVTGYDITHAINADGLVHEVRADYTIKAAGAGFNNGFGTLFEDVERADIASITGRTSSGTFAKDGNGTTASGDATEALVYNWDATKDIIVNDIAAGAFFNTVPGGGQGNEKTENVLISFVHSPVNTPGATGVSPWQLGLPPYNTFIVSNGDQTREVHLADMMESSLHNDGRYGTVDDDSNPGVGRYFKTVAPSNLPWALDIPTGTFAWPKERVDILTAYPQFGAWAASGGVVNTMWFNSPAAGQTYP